MYVLKIGDGPDSWLYFDTYEDALSCRFEGDPMPKLNLSR